MGWNGGGSVTLLYDWSARRDAGAPDHFIDADLMDAQQVDIASAIEATLNRNGENAIAADISWANFRILNLGDPTTATGAANASSVAENTLSWCGTTGGAANAQTASNTFIATVGTGTVIRAIAGFTNTGAMTLNVNSEGAVAVVRADGTSALTGNEVVAGDIVEFTYDGTSWVLTHSSLSQSGDFVDGLVTVGVNDDVPGALYLYGGGAGEVGGTLRIYMGADQDTTVDYWQWYGTSGDDNLRLQDNSGDVAILVRNDADVSLAPTTGIVEVGADDVTPGLLSVFGGATTESGGQIRVYNNFDDDGTVEYYRIEATDGTGNLDIGRAGQTDFYITASGDQFLAASTGAVTVGALDDTPGVLSLSGGGTGEQGGELRLYNNADDDTTVDWWGIEAEDSTGNLAFTQAGTTLAAFTDETVLAAFEIGVEDDRAGVLRIRGSGTGSVEGGQIELYTAADHDASINSYVIDVNEDDLRFFENGTTASLEVRAGGTIAFPQAYDGGILAVNENGVLENGWRFSSQSASSTSVDFTSLPDWITQIIVCFNGLSPNSDNNELLIQIGDSGGFVTSGYSAAAGSGTGSVTTGDGFIQNYTNEFDAAQACHGFAHLVKETAVGNLWSYQGVLNVGGVMHHSAGEKSIGTVLDRIRVLWIGGTTTFDAGAVRILYI